MNHVATEDRVRSAPPPGSPSLHELLRFERLMSDLSASFINLPAAQIDAVIENGLRAIVETLQIDRSSQSLFIGESEQLETTHSWTVPGLPSVWRSRALDDRRRR